MRNKKGSQITAAAVATAAPIALSQSPASSSPQVANGFADSDSESIAQKARKRKADRITDSATPENRSNQSNQSVSKSSKKDPGWKSLSSASSKVALKKSAANKVRKKDEVMVDVDKQCGVLLPNGKLCPRSLTCKTHSMSAKRSVPGRSQQFDVLLQMYQKRNLLKSHKQAFHAAQSTREEQPQSAIDSDEEVVQVMDAVSWTAARPLERRTRIPVQRRHKFFRAREMLCEALVKQNMSLQQQQVFGGILGRVIPFKAVVRNDQP